MKSPIYTEIDLVKTELEPGLTCWQCPESGGNWVPAPAYWQWHSTLPVQLKAHGVGITDTPVNTPHTDELLARPALLCPETHCILVRYKVGGLGIFIERSPVSGGIWLDAGEWNLLKENTLHASLHEIFTTSYQKRILREEAHQHLMEKFHSDLGEEVADTLGELADWLKTHPKKRRIIGWLHEQLALDEDDFPPQHEYEPVRETSAPLGQSEHTVITSEEQAS